MGGGVREVSKLGGEARIDCVRYVPGVLGQQLSEKNVLLVVPDQVLGTGAGHNGGIHVLLGLPLLRGGLFGGGHGGLGVSRGGVLVVVVVGVHGAHGGVGFVDVHPGGWG